MNLIGSKVLETERLLLVPHEEKYQYKLWEILMTEGVYNYYLAIPSKYREKLLSWKTQEPFYLEKVKHSNDKDIFDWCIILKENGECIGKIDCHELGDDKSIRDVGWYIDPVYQGKGYASEAANAMFNYMYNEVMINEIDTGAAIDNSPSWKIMEKFGFERTGSSYVNYTFIDEPVKIYTYKMTRNKYKGV